MNEPETIKKILAFNTIAIVGLSPKPTRASHRVAAYLKAVGYTIIPVNPKADDILGETCFPTLKDIPLEVDVVDIFRRPEQVLPIVEAAIEIDAKALWFQDGVINEAAAKRGEQAGLLVVMDDCMMRQHRRKMTTEQRK